MTPEQQRALALAKARLRLKKQQEVPEEPTLGEKVAGHPASRVAKGAASLLTGPFQLGANIGDKIAEWTGEEDPWVGDYVNEKLRQWEEAKNKGRKARGSEGFDWWELGGMVGSPMNMLKTGLTKTPKLAASGEKVAKSLASKVLEGGKVGALYGAGMPVTDGGEDFAKTKAVQATTGALVGGAIPLGVETTKLGGRLVDEATRPLAFRNTPGNWYEKMGLMPGIMKDTRDYMGELAGDSRKAIVDALNRAKSGQTSKQALAQASRGEKVVGSPLIKLEDDISKRASVSDLAKGRYGAQEAGREKVISAIAGTDDDMARAVAQRNNVTKPMYKAVEQSTQRVDAQPVVDRIDAILAKNKNESAVTAPLTALRAKLVGESGLETNPQNLYSLSKEIRNMMGKITPGGQKEYNVGVLDDIKGILDNQIGASEQSFNQAQTAYRDLSKPVNQMQVGQELKNALINPSEKEVAGTFMNAMRNAPRTLKRSTGFSRYDKLDDVLTPEQMGGVNKVADELLTNESARQIASKTRSTYPALQEDAKLQIAPMLERNVMIANALMRRVARKATPKYEKVAWDVLEDPKKLADLLKLPEDNPTRKAAMEYLQRMSILSPVGAVNQGAD